MPAWYFYLTANRYAERFESEFVVRIRYEGLKGPELRPGLKNTLFVIAIKAKQSHKSLIIEEIATARMRLAMTGSEFFKGPVV